MKENTACDRKPGPNALYKAFWPMAAIFLCAFCLRFGAGMYHLLKQGPVGDHNWYVLTENLLDGKGLIIDTPNATVIENYRSHRPPLFPLMLAGVRVLTSRSNAVTILFLAALSAAVVIPVYYIARELFGPAVAYCSAVVTAVYPFYVWHDASFMESGLYCLLTACLILSLVRFYKSPTWRAAVAAGICCGLAALTRGTCVPAALLISLWFLLLPPASFRKRLIGLALFLGCFGILLLPWIIRNYRVQGTLVYLTGNGRSLWIGNNELVGTIYPFQSIDAVEWMMWGKLTPEERREVRALSEVGTDRWFAARAREFVKAHPWQTAKLALRKVWAGFSPLMNPRERDEPLKYFIYSMSYGPVLILGVIGFWLERRRWREFSPILIAVVAFAGVSAVYWAHSRHRVFLDVYLIIFASYCIIHCVKTFLAGGEDHAEL